MTNITLDHFKRAAIDIGAHGDNDTLPFDIDNRFIKENVDALASMAFEAFSQIDKMEAKGAAKAINQLSIFSERLLVPTGSTGFRISTKIHPFWNVYMNGLGVCVAEEHEGQRSVCAHSYRFIPEGDGLFDRDKSWRAYRQATLDDKALQNPEAMVVQTDISSFYEHVYHHRLENCVEDLFPAPSTVSIQLDRMLNKLAAGRSFGLPVGGQCSRILAEVMMGPIDQRLTDEGLTWHRYVDDFTLITASQEDAYRALAILSHILADYGLTLNRTKTTILRAKHYTDYVQTQLGSSDKAASALREIDLHFDPYSDSAQGDYSELKQTVQKLDVQTLLNLELEKGQPDTYLVSQVSRTLKLHSPNVAIQLCATLLDAKNLNSFRASWSTIMRGIAGVRTSEECSDIFDSLDEMLDAVPTEAAHLLRAEASSLHYLRTIRFRRTDARAKFVLELYKSTNSETVKRGCIECWHHWHDRANFNRLRNQWTNLGVQEQRMLWLTAGGFGDEGKHARNQLRPSLTKAWKLGIEQNGVQTFADLYKEWAENGD